MAPKLPPWLIALSGVGTIGGAYVLLKGQDPPYDTKERIAGKTVIVTGANTGLGKETAMNLASRGGKIIMGCRDMEKCMIARDDIIEKTYNKNVHCKKLDLASFKSIREFAAAVNKEEEHLEVLVNNAGVMEPPKSYTEEGIELQMGVNYFGPFLLTHLLLDLLKESAPSRVVNVVGFPTATARINFKDLNSSSKYSPSAVYFQSKLALLMFSKKLGEKLAGSGVSTYAVYPGLASHTELDRHLQMNKWKISKVMMAPIQYTTMIPKEHAVQDIVYCAVEPSIADQTGQYWHQRKTLEPRPILDSHANRLWAVSEHWTDIKTDLTNMNMKSEPKIDVKTEDKVAQ